MNSSLYIFDSGVADLEIFTVKLEPDEFRPEVQVFSVTGTIRVPCRSPVLFIGEFRRKLKGMEVLGKGLPDKYPIVLWKTHLLQVHYIWLVEPDFSK